MKWVARCQNDQRQSTPAIPLMNVVAQGAQGTMLLNTASWHFRSLLKRSVPESTAHLFKKQYLVELNRRKHGEVPEVTSLLTKVCDCPLLLGSILDGQVRDYITVLRATAGVVNTATELQRGLLLPPIVVF